MEPPVIADWDGPDLASFIIKALKCARSIVSDTVRSWVPVAKNASSFLVFSVENLRWRVVVSIIISTKLAAL
ncbi:hypothetical protein NTE_02665 [Candidatus Nitrososphaera evergladensis SR1]|jgi:hypothetical protein|uniref:Uncharacterized protein n=1 Tax=Candidatus Nitrososphaera evergladensis SR1 TaxID=1459636 RepID=A0A075MU81_9ARCH|nr:hypothetical protein NTE_02665 [Candidatus Nitrososphaera evergladensis SR1]